MAHNFLLDKFKKGQQAIGTFMELKDTQIVESLAVGGLDFFIVDLEHSSMSTETLKPIVQTAELRQITPLVRVKNISRADILRPLDLGVQGLVIPDVRSVEEVKEIISWGKYKPLGQRGFFTSRITDFGYSDEMQDLDALFNYQNENTLLIPQCETVESLENIEEIAALDGVDGIFVGPFDLSISMGIPTQFDHPRFVEALQRIYDACKKNDKFIFIFGANPEAAKKLLSQGYDAVTCGMDTNLIIDSARQMLAEIKNCGR